MPAILRYGRCEGPACLHLCSEYLAQGRIDLAQMLPERVSDDAKKLMFIAHDVRSQPLNAAQPFRPIVLERWRAEAVVLHDYRPVQQRLGPNRLLGGSKCDPRLVPARPPRP